MANRKRTHAAVSTSNMDMDDEDEDDGDVIALSPPRSKRQKLRSTLARAATMFHDSDEDDAADSSRTRREPEPLAFRTRPARGIYDHIEKAPTGSSFQTSVDYRRQYNSDTALNDKEVQALASIDRHGYPHLDGGIIDLSKLSADTIGKLIPGMDARKLARILSNWSQDKARNQFIELLNRLHTNGREKLLTEIEESLEKYDKEYGPTWVDMRANELRKRQSNPWWNFASLVTQTMGASDIRTILMPTVDIIEQGSTATLNEYRSTLQSYSSLAAAQSAIAINAKQVLDRLKDSSTRFFEKVFPVIPLDFAKIGEYISLQHDVLKKMATTELKTVMLPDKTTPVYSDIDKILDNNKDQYFLSLLVIVSNSVSPSMTTFRDDLIEEIKARTNFKDKKDPTVVVANPPYAQEGVGGNKATMNIKKLQSLLLPNLQSYLGSSLMLIAGGVSANKTSIHTPDVTTFLNQEIQVAARALANRLVDRNRNSAWATVLGLPPDLQVYQLLRPFIPTAWAAQASSTADVHFGSHSAIVNARLLEQANDLYATFGLSKKSTWGDIQLVFRNLETDATHDQDTFLHDLQDGLRLLRTKTEIDVDWSKNPNNLLTEHGLDVLVELINTLGSGSELRSTAEKIGKAIENNALEDNWNTRLTAQTNLVVTSWRQLENFVECWEPSITLDIRFACLTPLTRYQVVRSFLLDISTVIRYYYNLDFTRKQKELAETQQRIANTTKRLTEFTQTAYEQVNWEWQPEHSRQILYSDLFNAAITKAAAWIADIRLFTMNPRFKIQPNLWINPKKEWGDDAQLFTVLFADITAYLFQTPRIVMPSLYVEQIKVRNMDNRLRDLIARLLSFEYYSESYSDEGWFRKRRQPLTLEEYEML